MPAYLLIVLAVLTRLVPHPDWLNFTAVGGALLYFGARRSWREMLAPLAALMATDYCLTVFSYHYPFQWQSYITTWAWYIMAMALGHILLHAKTTFVRVAAGVVLGPTSFFILSNYAVWAGSDMYPPTLTGLRQCFIAAIPFYRNDLISTAIVAGLAFGVPVMVRRLRGAEPQPVLAGK
jgi:DMSO reductase anchor subunit